MLPGQTGVRRNNNPSFQNVKSRWNMQSTSLQDNVALTNTLFGSYDWITYYDSKRTSQNLQKETPRISSRTVAWSYHTDGLFQFCVMPWKRRKWLTFLNLISRSNRATCGLEIIRNCLFTNYWYHYKRYMLAQALREIQIHQGTLQNYTIALSPSVRRTLRPLAIRRRWNHWDGCTDGRLWQSTSPDVFSALLLVLACWPSTRGWNRPSKRPPTWISIELLFKQPKSMPKLEKSALERLSKNGVKIGVCTWIQRIDEHH